MCRGIKRDSASQPSTAAISPKSQDKMVVSVPPCGSLAQASLTLIQVTLLLALMPSCLQAAVLPFQGNTGLQLRELRGIVQQSSTDGKPKPWRPYFMGHACENTLLTVTCPRGRKLSIAHAMYGHSAHAQCPGQINLSNKSQQSSSCRGLGYSNRGRRILSEMCNGLSRCEIPVLSFLFGDPCPSSPKYLEVYYGCVAESAVLKS